jgi:hypothetical protein
MKISSSAFIECEFKISLFEIGAIINGRRFDGSFQFSTWFVFFKHKKGHVFIISSIEYQDHDRYYLHVQEERWNEKKNIKF